MRERVVVFQRRKKRDVAKSALRKTGKGLSLGAFFVMVPIIVLPMILGRMDAKKRLVELKNSQITFSDLLRIDADNALKVTQATYFTLEIPKIQAHSKVIANVDAGNKYEYIKALQDGVAHAKGTNLPGMGGATTLFSHSTDISANVGRYNAVFYRLDELKKGDKIVVWFLGERLDYQVTGTKITAPDDVSMFVKNNQSEKLYLVTCTPRGTTRNRLIVEANLTGV